MAMQIISTSDTIIVKAVFKDENGDPVDPDSNAATFTVYLNEDLSVSLTNDAVRISTGTYSYDWLVPDADGIAYILEMKGLFSSEPQLKRLKVKAKFRP